jgi:hypothetical protein
MKNRFIAVAFGLLLLALAVPHEAAACERCAFAGFVCNADYCDYIIACVAVQVGHVGGANDCYSDSFTCYTSGGLCQWASIISPTGQPYTPQVQPPALNHSLS